MHSNNLKQQRKIILRQRKINIFLLSFGVLFFSVCLYATFLNVLVIFILPIPLVIILLAVKDIAENNRLLKQFSNIWSNKPLNKTYPSKLYCPKIFFLTYPEVISHASSSPKYYGVTVTDSNKNKYYYFFEECMRYDKESISMIRKRFSCELDIQCYENTNIIKTIANDPHFVHIRFGSLCK